jgi:hypothetical protein
MTFRQSVAVVNASLDAIETTIGTSAKLDIYSGPPPATCATAASGTKLASLTLPSDWIANASTGTKVQAGTWSGTAIANGYAGYGRILESTDTTCGMQFCIGQTWTASTAYYVNQQVNNGANCYKCTTAGTSAGSGGPTGTGSGITDNTAVWAYVEPKDLTMDNTNIATGQTVNVTSFTIDGTANV